MIDPEIAVVVTRFWSKVDRRGPDECWPWTGYLEDGYGLFYDGTRMRPAHEMAVTFTTGETRLQHLETCHSCDNPPCCNPNHLRFGTRQSNVDDAVSRRRHAHGESHGFAKLTEAQVVEMRLRGEAGATGKTLAEHYGISQAYVSTILTGQTWAHVGGPIRQPLTRKATA